jgi:hypothetical protein
MQHTQSDHIAALIGWYDSSTEDVRAEGRSWYTNQREICRELAATHSRTVSNVAAVMAALSPMTRWTENVAGTIRLLRAVDQDESADPPRNCTLFYKNAQKAWLIARYDIEPETAFAGSPKVAAFWRNLTGDESDVTIDTWMLRAVGEDQLARQGIKPKPYREIAQAVKDAAALVGETPAQFQAIVWIQIRREMSRYDTANEGTVAA